MLSGPPLTLPGTSKSRRPPVRGAMVNRRWATYLLGIGGFIVFVILLASSGGSVPVQGTGRPLAYTNTPIHHVEVDVETLKGEAIMPKLGNETLKAELGRAAWKLFHTTMARFPDTPTKDEQTALFSYIHLFARLYPCGECAGHFRKVLEKYPPQVTSRGKAAVWGCHVHNVVNKRLGKDEFDCAKIGDFYDCGCAEDPDDEAAAAGGKKGSGGMKKAGTPGAAAAAVAAGDSGEGEAPTGGKSKHRQELKLEKDDQIRGG